MYVDYTRHGVLRGVQKRLLSFLTDDEVFNVTFKPTRRTTMFIWRLEPAAIYHVVD